MFDRGRRSEAMIIIVYAIRSDAAASEYEDWVRRVDCPFFNAAPGIAQYVNWKVVGGRNVLAPYRYFDFVMMHGMESFEAVWLDAKLNAFRQRWRDLWGVTNDYGAHAPAHLCRRVAKAAMAWTPHLALRLSGADDRVAGWDTWRIERPLRGTPPPFAAFQFRYLSGPDEFPRLPIAPDSALLGSCIAAP